MNNAFAPSSSRSLDSQRTMRGNAPTPARRLRAGDVLLARYTVLSELGEGGMGVVYKCLDQVGGIEVAVKCLPPELSRNEGEMEGIRENYGIVAKLHHSAISGLRNLEKDPATGEYYLVMDLAEGEDLSAILRRRRGAPMPLEEALAILRPLASALDYAHGERVLHRDVKPANVKVLVTGESDHATIGPCDHATTVRVQLLDFGLAAEVRSSMSRVSVRGHGGTSGTPAYMAPEQWEARRPDFRTDQYALAVMAYQMLAGFLPFDSEDTDVLRRAVLSRAPDPVEGLPSAANAALLRALAKDPKERFPTCAAFVAALSSPSEGRDGSASRPSDGRAAGASLPETAGADTSSVKDEAALLLRKAALQEALAAISDADRADKEFALLVKEATRAFRAAEDALKFGRIPAFASCLDRTDAALESLRRAKDRRKEEAERAARAEAERIRREREAAARAAAERERRREEEARLEAERQREEFDRACADAKRPQRRKARTVVGSLFSVLLVSVIVGLLKSCTGSRETPEPPMSESRRAAIVEQLVRNMVHIPGKDYLMGKYEVMQEEWEAVTGERPSRFKGGRRPVEQVSWDDCQDFIRKLNVLPAVKESGLTFRLPFEEEWEYACRAGSTGAYCRLADGTEITENSLGLVAWIDRNAAQETHPVGQKEPNAFGLYDMHGNVWEWTQTAVGEDRVNRGGCWFLSARGCESSGRCGDSPGDRYYDLGFRLCASGRAD